MSIDVCGDNKNSSHGDETIIDYDGEAKERTKKEKK